MIAGVPLETWIVGALAIVPGLALVVMFFRAHHGSTSDRPDRN